MGVSTKSLSACVLCAAIWMTGCNNNQPNEKFHHGRELLIKGDFDAADAELTDFENQNPNHALLSRARFLRAKSRLGAGELDEARRLFQDTIDRFPKSEEADKARFKIALIDFLRSDLPAAEQGFQTIVDQSGSIYAAEANAMLDMLRQRPIE